MALLSLLARRARNRDAGRQILGSVRHPSCVRAFRVRSLLSSRHQRLAVSVAGEVRTGSPGNLPLRLIALRVPLPGDSEVKPAALSAAVASPATKARPSSEECAHGRSAGHTVRAR